MQIETNKWYQGNETLLNYKIILQKYKKIILEAKNLKIC